MYRLETLLAQMGETTMGIEDILTSITNDNILEQIRVRHVERWMMCE